LASIQETVFMSEWYEEELAEVDLGDRRLNKRAAQVLGSLGKQPSQSIPGSCRSWAETLAAYRLFSNEQVTSARLLAPHFAATRERMREHPVVLLVQDSSELDYTGKESSTGLGRLNWEARQREVPSLELGDSRGAVLEPRPFPTEQACGPQADQAGGEAERVVGAQLPASV
jgi:hypothetical protein